MIRIQRSRLFGLGWGQLTDAHARGSVHFTERLRFRQEGKTKNKVGLRTDNKGKGGTRQLWTDASFMKTCRCNAHDAMRWHAWHEQNAKRKTKTQPRRKYHIASPEKARVGVTNMESCIRGVTILHHHERISSQDLGWHQREKKEEEKR